MISHWPEGCRCSGVRVNQIAKGTAQQQLHVVQAQLVTGEGVHIDLAFAARQSSPRSDREADPLHIQPELAAQLYDENAEANRYATLGGKDLGEIRVGGRKIILPVTVKTQGLVEPLQQLAAYLVTTALGNRFVQPGIETGQLGSPRPLMPWISSLTDSASSAMSWASEIGPFVYTYHRHHP